MTRSFVGLGSNMGDRLAHLQKALEDLPDVVSVSQVYETAPVGGPSGQDPYLNAVVELDTELAPRQLLEIGKRLESEAGRVRTKRWGPRPLDVDVLFVDGVELHEVDLEVPHPRMWQRRFVLAPLSELAPDLVSPHDLERAGGAVRGIGRLLSKVI